MTPIFALPFLTPTTMIIALVVGVLLFGRKLPELGKYLGKGIVEFKKGVAGIEDEVSTSSAPVTAATETPRPPQRVGNVAPKFEDVPART